MEGFNGWAVATAYRFYLLPNGYDPLEATLSWPSPHPHLWPWGWVSGTLFGDDSGGCGKHKIWFEEAGGVGSSMRYLRRLKSSNSSIAHMWTHDIICILYVVYIYAILVEYIRIEDRSHLYSYEWVIDIWHLHNE